jgi:hypothetical protein
MKIEESDLWDLGEHDLLPLFNISYRRATVKIKDLVNVYFPQLEFHTRTWPVSLRDPEDNWYSATSGPTRAWHQDWLDDTHPDRFKIILCIWSSKYGTELKRPRGNVIYECKPNHLYVVDNVKWKHRAPSRKGKSAAAMNRYFMRLVAKRPLTMS